MDLVGLGDEGRANTRETQDPPSKNEDGAPGGETQEPARCRRYKGRVNQGLGGSWRGMLDAK